MTLLEPSDQKLYRQVRGSGGHINDGIPTSLAFKPMPNKDQGELSIDLASLTTAQSSFERFKSLPGDSVGVWAVTTQECKDTGLDAYHKPKTDPPQNLSHGIIDFRHLTSDGQRKKKAAKLVEWAIRHGRQWPLMDATESTQNQSAQQGQTLEQLKPTPENSMGGPYERLIDMT